MKHELCNTIDGKQVVRLIPESDEDVAEIRRLDEAGLIDATMNFADDADARRRHTNREASASRSRQEIDT